MPTIADQLHDLADRIARFPAGETVDVPAYLEEHGNPDAAKKWVEMNDEHGDKFKKKAAHGYVVDITFMKPDRSEGTHRNKHFSSWEDMGRYADDLVAEGFQILNISV